jgi:hypothetical protein
MSVNAQMEAADLSRGAIMGAATKQLESALELASEAHQPNGVADWLSEELTAFGFEVSVTPR